MGEQVIVDLMRKRDARRKQDFCDHMRIRTDYPTQSLKVWVGRDIQETDDPVLDVWLAYTPLDAEQRTNRTYGYLSVKKPRMPGLIHAVWPASSGSPKTSSARIRKSSNTSSGPMTRRAPTGTTRCSRPARPARRAGPLRPAHRQLRPSVAGRPPPSACSTMGETMAMTGHRSVQSVMGYYQSGELSTSRAARSMDADK